MSSILFKKFSLLFLIISAAFVSTSVVAGRVHKSVESNEVSTSYEEGKSWEAVWHDEEEREIHERILKVKTNDYGRYDPAPAFVKPPFKLIPN